MRAQAHVRACAHQLKHAHAHAHERACAHQPKHAHAHAHACSGTRTHPRNLHASERWLTPHTLWKRLHTHMQNIQAHTMRARARRWHARAHGPALGLHDPSNGLRFQRARTQRLGCVTARLAAGAGWACSKDFGGHVHVCARGRVCSIRAVSCV